MDITIVFVVRIICLYKVSSCSLSGWVWTLNRVFATAPEVSDHREELRLCSGVLRSERVQPNGFKSDIWSANVFCCLQRRLEKPWVRAIWRSNSLERINFSVK